MIYEENIIKVPKNYFREMLSDLQNANQSLYVRNDAKNYKYRSTFVAAEQILEEFFKSIEQNKKLFSSKYSISRIELLRLFKDLESIENYYKANLV